MTDNPSAKKQSSARESSMLSWSETTANPPTASCSVDLQQVIFSHHIFSTSLPTFGTCGAPVAQRTQSATVHQMAGLTPAFSRTGSRRCSSLMSTANFKENLPAAFKKCELSPIDRNEVLERILTIKEGRKSPAIWIRSC